MRHPCEPSEYQFHYDRSYLRTPHSQQTGGVVNGQINLESPPSGVQNARYPVPNRDLDILFEVKKSKKPGECLANIQYDTRTGEVLSIKPLNTTHRPSTSSGPDPASDTDSERGSKKEEESLATRLTLSSFTRHGYNVEHIKGAISGPLPGMVTKEARTGKHRHDPTRTTVQDHYRPQ